MIKLLVKTAQFIIFTWGCQMNEDDSEQISNILMQMGYSPTNNAEEADIAILVTCSVRAKPENKAKSKLGELREIKLNRPEMIIGVCGCMAQREGKELKKHRPYLDMVIGTAGIQEIPAILNQIYTQRGFKSALEMPTTAADELIVPERKYTQENMLKSFVPVMYGCDNFCSYCIVPYVRGRERSRELSDIIHEVKYLAEHGRKEITLLGQNVNSYGQTLSYKTDFSQLLSKISQVDGIERIRFTTSHPKDLSDKLIDIMASLPKVCKHIHLAVQSGDDEILSRMNRKYDSAKIRERIKALRSSVPEIAISTDFLVGFPGESLEQFQNTIELAKEIRFDNAFMFAYNAIPNTAAAKLDDQISFEEKNRRLRELIKVQTEITCEINKSMVGKVFQVLVEGVSQKSNIRLTGLTSQNKTVNFEGNEALIGRMVDIEVIEGFMWGFMGKLV